MSGLQIKKGVERIIAQIKFRPTLLSWQNTILAAHSLENKYQEWRLNKQSDIILYSPDEKKALRACYDSITYSNDSSNNTSELIKHIGTIYEKSVKDSGVKDLGHVGFRNVQILGTNFSFQELADLIYSKFYKVGDVSSISSEKIKDTAFSLDGEKNNIFNRVKIGPMVKEEAVRNFSGLFNIDESKLDSDSYLYVDVDAYLLEVNHKNEEIEKVLEFLISENKRISSDYLAYIKKIDD